FSPSNTADVYSYGVPQDKAARKGSGSTDVAQSSFSAVAASLAYTFPSYSATVQSLPARAATAPLVTPAALSVKNSTIAGSALDVSTRVLINNLDVSGRIKTASDNVIKIKAKAKALGLVSGDNMIQVITAGGASSNVFTLTL